MSIGKRTHPGYRVFYGQDMSINFDNQLAANNSLGIGPNNIQNDDNVGYLLQIIGSPVGVFQLYGGAQDPQNSNALIWAPINQIIQPINGAINIWVPVIDVWCPWIYLSYTATSGAGNCNCWLTTKAK